MSGETFKAAILGASGYTGAELVRLLKDHPSILIEAMTADRFAGQELKSLFPHLASLKLPTMQKIDSVDFANIDVIFCCLPHGLTQDTISSLLKRFPNVKVVDLSADFRLVDAQVYETTYGGPHKAQELQKEAVYGLTEWERSSVSKARLVANPGCYTTTCQLPLIPLLKDALIQTEDIIVDAASGISGAGRAVKENLLLSEHDGNFSAYGVGNHRHGPEIDQVLSAASGVPITVSFTPHLLPFPRGILATTYIKLSPGKTIEDVRRSLDAAYNEEFFVHMLPVGKSPELKNVRGTNFCHIGVFEDRVPGKVILVSALDNLMKGASGQALQNMNLMLGLEETLGLDRLALVP